jgi:serine/threonine protein kinase
MDMGRLSLSEALRLSSQLAEALRRVHEQGQVHGALTPDLIDLEDTGLQIRSAPDGTASAITPYTAAEVMKGQVPDAKADIFAFGAILYEMAAGRRTFNSEWEARSSLGNPALEKVIRACVAEDPNARVPRIQRVMLEIKLAAVTARKAEAAEGLRRQKANGATRDHLQELEARLEARLAAQAEAYDVAIEDMRRAQYDSNEALREQVEILCSELVVTQERLATVIAVPIDQQVTGLLAGPLTEVNNTIKALSESTETLKRTVDDMARRSQQFEQRTASELIDLGRNVKANAVAIEAAQMGQAQNEELLERVIETLEALQSDVLGPEATVAQEAVLAR